VAAQRSHEVGNRITGVALVDPVTLGGKVTRWRLDGMGSLCALNAVGDNRAACWPSIAVLGCLSGRLDWGVATRPQ
jgi:hypothetical protein